MRLLEIIPLFYAEEELGDNFEFYHRENPRKTYQMAIIKQGSENLGLFKFSFKENARNLFAIFKMLIL